MTDLHKYPFFRYPIMFFLVESNFIILIMDPVIHFLLDYNIKYFIDDMNSVFLNNLFPFSML